MVCRRKKKTRLNSPWVTEFSVCLLMGFHLHLGASIIEINGTAEQAWHWISTTTTSDPRQLKLELMYYANSIKLAIFIGKRYLFEKRNWKSVMIITITSFVKMNEFLTFICFTRSDEDLKNHQTSTTLQAFFLECSPC